MAAKTLELKNNIGNTLQLQLSPQTNEDERFYVKLLGYLENKNIIVTSPRVDGAPLKINPEQKFIVRMMSDKTAQFFTTTAIHSTSEPFPHLFLAFPEKFDSFTIRKAERVHCKLNVGVQNEEPDNDTYERKSALMHNVSTAGALLYSTEDLGRIGDTVSIKMVVNVSDIDQDLIITAIIRRVVLPSEGKDIYEYGVEFILLEDNAKSLLHGFVSEHIAHES